MHYRQSTRFWDTPVQSDACQLLIQRDRRSLSHAISIVQNTIALLPPRIKASGIPPHHPAGDLGHLFVFLLGRLESRLNPKESPNREAIELVMFICFVDQVEIKLFLKFWSPFSASALQKRATVLLHCLECCCLLLMLVHSYWLGYWLLCVFLDGTMSRLCLSDEIWPLEEVKRRAQ